MKIGLQLVCQRHSGLPDAEMFTTETKLALEAEAMGFDFVGLVEHDLGVNVSFGSMPCEDVRQQARLFAEKVMPRLGN